MGEIEGEYSLKDSLFFILKKILRFMVFEYIIRKK